MTYRQRRSTEQRIVEGILKGIWYLLTLPFGGLKKKKKIAIDQSEVQSRWSTIEELSLSNDPHQIGQAIIIADKLLDALLVAEGKAGNTMGDRLKAAQDLFSNQTVYQGLWQAHKLRNEIAHNLNHTVDITQGKQAIDLYKKGIFTLI